MKKLLLTTASAAVAATMAMSSVAIADPHTDALEQRLKIMEEQMRIMHDELARVREEALKPSEKVLELEEWVAKVQKIGPQAKEDLVFFRGGFARNDTDRTGDILTDANSDNSGGAQGILNGLGTSTRGLTGNEENGDSEGWYFGAGIEHSLTPDLFGLWDGTEVMAEIMFEYKEFDQADVRRAPLATAANDSATGASGVAPGLGSVVCANTGTGNGGLIANGGGPYGTCSNSIHVTQFTLSAAPKIKFMKGSDFRPWVIPAGFAFHVISPPSDGVTVNTVGMMFGAGAEYRLYENIYLGLDARYHLTDNALDGVKIDGLTAGGYLGFGF